MNSPERTRALAERLMHAHRARTTFAIEPALVPTELAEAYAIQDTVARGLWTQHGDPINAWKTGGPNAQAIPIAAPIPRSKVHRSPARLAGDDVAVVGIEAELAYTLDRDLPPRNAPYADADVGDAISEVRAAIEVCSSRLRDWSRVPPLAKLADNQQNAALIVGTGVHDWRDVAYHQQSAIVEIDGTPCARAVGTHPYGDPSRLITWLANHCAVRCGGLRAGDIVTTGAWTGMHPVRAGASILVRFPSIGEARVVFDAARDTAAS